uniref:Uncharacterized protein n=1 Tax=Cucumis melo TaxID=3656 RepID=A0A9I9EAE0_CUCME
MKRIAKRKEEEEEEEEVLYHSYLFTVHWKRRKKKQKFISLIDGESASMQLGLSGIQFGVYLNDMESRAVALSQVFGFLDSSSESRNQSGVYCFSTGFIWFERIGVFSMDSSSAVLFSL